MLEGLYSAAAGMAAQQQQLDAIGNDLANVSTTGYKTERVAFSDLLYNRFDEAGTETTTGAGANARTIGASSAQGSIRETGDPLHMAIEGEGFFQVKNASGQVKLTRDGSFGVDATGTLVNASGDRLEPPIKLPAGVSPEEVSIAADGKVTAGGKTLGQVKLVTVAAPDRLLADGDGRFLPTTESGAPSAVAASRIQQGALEESNVNMGREMALMITTQRAFQMSSTAIQNESQMMSIANQLKP
jgi:flagellar basal-body rod protein FlgG